MLRAIGLSMPLLLLPLASASAEGPANLADNAALNYWQAFAQLPKLTDADAQKLNAEYLTMPLDAHTREIINKADYALRMMHQGAALRDCTWAIGWKEEGIDALLPQMNAARVLSSLACLRARLRFQEGKSADALSDILAAFTLGRHVSLDGSLIGVLVGYNIEGRLGECLALHLPRLTPREIKDLQKRLADLPLGGRPATALRTCEENTLDWLTRKVKEAKDRDSLLSLLSFLESSEGKSPRPGKKARAFLEACGGTAEGILRFVEAARPSYARLAAKLDLPPDQFENEYKQELNRQAGNPVFKEFFPAIASCRWAQARADVRRALLAAALAVQLDGRDALKAHPDPVSGGPFEYVPFEGGFELRAKKTRAHDQPLTLTVGPR